MAKLKQAADKYPILTFYVFEFIAVLPFSLSAAKPASTIFGLFILALYFCLRYFVFKLRAETNAKSKLAVEALFVIVFNALIIFVCEGTNDILFGIFALCAIIPTAVFEIKRELDNRRNGNSSN